MLAGGGPQREQPLLRLLQQPRIDIRIGDEPRQQRFRLRQRLLRSFQRGERRIAPGSACRLRLARGRQALQRPRRRAQRGRRPGAAPITWCQLRQRRGDRLGPPFALLQPLAFARQVVFFIDPRRQGGKFLDRVPQPFLVAFGSGDGRASRVPAGAAHPATRCHASDTAIRARAGAPRTHPAGRRGWRHQPTHLLVLALHLHQQCTDTPQQADADRMVIDEGARAAILLTTRRSTISSSAVQPVLV